METWGVVFLGVIAAGSLVQAGFLVGLARDGRRLGRRIEQMQDRLDHEIRPSLEHLNRVTRNAAEVSDLALLQARRLDHLLADTATKVEETTTAVKKAVLRPLEPLADLAALFRGIRRGIEVYNALRGVDSERRGASRRYTEDEHLFI